MRAVGLSRGGGARGAARRAAEQSTGGWWQHAGRKATRKEKSFWNKFCFLIVFLERKLCRIDENLSGEAWQDSGNDALSVQGVAEQ